MEIAAGATLQLAYTGDQINDTARVTIDGGTFHLGTFYETVAGVTLDNGGVIRNGQLTSTSAFDLRSGTVIAGLAGSAGLNKTTGATVTLNQQLNTPYTYTGATAITGGTLIVNGSASGSTAEANRVTIGGGARLAGAGSIARPTTVMTGGSIAPGDPTAGLGTLTTGSETWEDGSFAAFRLGNTAADRLAIGGTLTAGHATVVLTSFGLVTSTLTDSTWTLASTTGEITGLANLLLDTSALGAVDGRFSLGLSSNNANLLLSYSTVPEPATGALLFGAAALVAARRIRRRRRA